jgi:uncharacterized membrane protein
MKYDFRVLFLLFIIYSFCGWFVEVMQGIIRNKKFVNRGFLIGPYCPIYGCGAITMVLLLSKYLDDVVALFVMCIVLFSLLEYTTSYAMEKIFKARWWDYSRYKFNINGRICLETMVPFGLVGVFVMYIVNPFFVHVIESLPSILLTIFTILIGILFVVDILVSINAVESVNKTAKKVRKDSTEEITKKVKELLLDKNYVKRRLIKAFPKLKIK